MFCKLAFPVGAVGHSWCRLDRFPSDKCRLPCCQLRLSGVFCTNPLARGRVGTHHWNAAVRRIRSQGFSRGLKKTRKTSKHRLNRGLHCWQASVTAAQCDRFGTFLHHRRLTLSRSRPKIGPQLMTQPWHSSVKVFGRYFSPTRYSRELCGNPGNCADENQDTLSVESVFWMVLSGGGRYDQSNTEEGAHHSQAE